MGLLPTEKTTPKTELSDFVFLLHSPPKLGKTTFAAEFPDAVFLATEQGHNSLSCFKVDVPSWDVLLSVGTELAAGGHGFKSVILDTADNALSACRNYVCKKHNVDHEADLSYGKGYSLILNEFGRVLTKFSMLGLGLVLISHSEVLEITTRTGTTHKIVPSLKSRARKLALGMSDFIFYGDSLVAKDANGAEALQRIWRTKPHPNYEAGDRTGRLPDPLPMDFSVFKAAFDQAVSAQLVETTVRKDQGKPKGRKAASKSA